MQTKTFSELISGIATLLQIAQPAPAAASLQLIVDEMPVTLMDNAAVQADSVIFVCDFGALPSGPNRGDILQELLQSNLYTVSTGAPTFCVNADNSHALFVGKLAIAQTSVNRMLNAFTEFAKEAREWRRNCQSDASTNNNRGLPARQHSLLHMAHAAKNP